MAKAYYEKTFIWHDELLFFLAHGRKVSTKYACILVEEETFLCWRATADDARQYEAGTLSLRAWFRMASYFFTTTHHDFDTGWYELKHILVKDVKREWWPGEDDAECLA